MKALTSLVKGTKSSTLYPVKPAVNIKVGFYDFEIDNINREAKEVTIDNEKLVPESEYLPQQEEWIDPHENIFVDESKAGQYLRLECDEWRSIQQTSEGAPYTPLDSEHSVRKATLIIQTKSSHKPPIQSGERWTDHVSDRAKRSIEQSAMYMHNMGKGYRTFITLTFTPEWRSQIDKWDHEPKDTPNRKSIGEMLSSFINTLQQRHRNGLTVKTHYRRDGKQQIGGSYYADGRLFKGHIKTTDTSCKWTPIKTRSSFKIKAQNRPFQFIWVAECPTNAEGETNPHVHMLINWHVKKDQFHAWAMWIEKTWGKGFAKIEKIRKPEVAAYYLSKAARYITKGDSTDQGLIRGNRYNIARDARPPKPRLIGVFAADTMHKHLNNYLDLERKHWPESTWFHRYGFGCNDKKAWDSLFDKLLGDGFTLKPPPLNLHAAMLRNHCARQTCKIRNNIDLEQSEFLSLLETK